MDAGAEAVDAPVHHSLAVPAYFSAGSVAMIPNWCQQNVGTKAGSVTRMDPSWSSSSVNWNMMPASVYCLDWLLQKLPRL